MPGRRARGRRALSVFVWLLNGRRGHPARGNPVRVPHARAGARIRLAICLCGWHAAAHEHRRPNIVLPPHSHAKSVGDAHRGLLHTHAFCFPGRSRGPDHRIFRRRAQPIEYYTFGQGERQYLIVAGIHGGYEGNTTDLANQMVVHLSEHPDIVPGDATLFIIPNMNPDGTARGRNVDGRTNANGVDLNRNFPSHNWVADWDHGNCWNYRPTTGGTVRRLRAGDPRRHELHLIAPHPGAHQLSLRGAGRVSRR